MSARRLEGAPIARQIRQEVEEGLHALLAAGGPVPHLAVLQAGDDPAATTYVRGIVRSFEGASMRCTVRQLPADVSAAAFGAAVRDLSHDPGVHGIIVQTPLPPQVPLDAVLDALDPAKDVDGIHPLNAGLLALGTPRFVPATPLGGLELLRRSGVPLKGVRAVVIGRSNVVGKPMALLLLGEHATVTICHSRTMHLAAVAREAEVLVAAIGRARFVTPEFVQPGATVVDFGINVEGDAVVGDVDERVAEVAGAITPVPGGTGPVTRAVLLRNTLEAARAQAGLGR